MDKIIEQAYAKIEEGFPVRFVAKRTGIDYRILFKMEKKRNRRVNDDFSNFCAWLLENESSQFKAEFNNIINKVNYKELSISVVPQYWFISIYIFLKHKENKENKFIDLYPNFSITEPTFRKYRKEILKMI